MGSSTSINSSTTAATSVLYGLLCGPPMAQGSTIMMEVVNDPEKFDFAYGIDVTLYGVTSFAGPCIVQFLVGKIGNYYEPFYASAGMFFISSMLSFCAYFSSIPESE